MEEVGEVLGAEFIYGQEGMEHNFKVHAEFDRQPGELLHSRCRVIDG